MKIGFLGPRGTYSHQAALQVFGLTKDPVWAPFDTITSVFQSTDACQVDVGVVPYENTIVGRIGETTRALQHFADISATEHVRLAIQHCLLSQQSDYHDLKKIYSHSEAINQCRHWLSLYCPEAQLMAVQSTAAAAELATQQPYTAAIASRFCTTLYPALQVLAEGIQDQLDNFTTFIVIRRSQ